MGWAIRGRSGFARPYPTSSFLIDIGPGANLSADFYNIDWSWRPGVDRCVDISQGMNLPSGRVSGVFTEHCLEHLEIKSVQTVLRDVYFALVEGAFIRIVVPDLEIYARKYIESIESGRNCMPYADGGSSGLLTPAAPFNDVMREHGHKFIYDFETMEKMLRDAGFRNVTRCSFRQGQDPRLLKDSEHRRAESLYVEAQK